MPWDIGTPSAAPKDIAVETMMFHHEVDEMPDGNISRAQVRMKGNR